MGPDDETEGLLRIGELARRVGVTTESLRAWERRYALFSPTRTAGGYRLYSGADELRLRRMLAHLARGLSAAEAARLARSESEGQEPEHAPPPIGDGAPGDALAAALDSFDEPAAHAAFDRLISAYSLTSVLRDAVLPYLASLGDRWRHGEVTIGQEHFASALLRGRLLGLARGWGAGRGPLAVLACAPADQHDLALMCFGLILRGEGWRITFLGPNTPLPTITETARVVQPTVVVLTATLTQQLDGHDEDLVELARTVPLALAGGGASAGLAERVGAQYLGDDPVTSALRVASER